MSCRSSFFDCKSQRVSLLCGREGVLNDPTNKQRLRVIEHTGNCWWCSNSTAARDSIIVPSLLQAWCCQLEFASTEKGSRTSSKRGSRSTSNITLMIYCQICWTTERLVIWFSFFRHKNGAQASARHTLPRWQNTVGFLSVIRIFRWQRLLAAK